MKYLQNPRKTIGIAVAMTFILTSSAWSFFEFIDACGTVSVNGVPTTNVLITAWFCDDDDIVTNDVLAASTVSVEGLPAPYNYHVEWTGPELGEPFIGSGRAARYYLVFSYADCDPVIVTCGEIDVLIQQYDGKIILDVDIPCAPDGGGGHTPGFWQNKNGQALITPADVTMLNDCCLRNDDGSDAVFADKEAFKYWLKSRRAKNMAYQLSGQLAAMKLNVSVGFVDGGALVYIDGDDMISIDDLIADADAALCDDGLTLKGDVNRDYQETLKDALDEANNNQNWVNP